MIPRTHFHRPAVLARWAGGLWLTVFLLGVASLALGRTSGARITDQLASLAYAAATCFVFRILQPVNPTISLLAAIISLAGCVSSLAGLARITHINSLVFFGGHCALVGYLIIRSTFLPNFIGVLMLLAGAGWLTYAWPPLARTLAPFNMAPGMVGELVLILWFLFKGVDEGAWRASAMQAP
jgi:hypothetical protein